jgi:hypothetical protein
VSTAGGRDLTPELARNLAHLIAQATVGEGAARVVEPAHDLARLLALPGLARLLAVAAAHGDRPWSTALAPAVVRVRELGEACARAGSIDPLRAADAELDGRAARLEGLAGAAHAESSEHRTGEPRSPRSEERRAATGTGTRPAEGAVTAARALADLALAGDLAGDRLERVKLSAPVAAALRSAVDWLLGEEAAHVPLVVSGDDASLTASCERVTFAGVQSAADVLESVGAHLGPDPRRPGAWFVRVPVLEERETFRLIEQGGLALAVPWPAATGCPSSLRWPRARTRPPSAWS